MNFSPIIKNREVLINTKPACRYDSSLDFAVWQKEAREKLVELLGIDDFVACPEEFSLDSKTSSDAYDEYQFSIQSEYNYRFTATLRVPAGAAGKLPLAICLFGHSDDLSAALDGDSDRDLCAQALARGYCSLAVEQRDFDNCFAIKDVPVEEAFTRTTWCACYRSSMRAAMLGRTTLGERVWDVMRAIDAVLSNFDMVDPAKISIMGNSGSATAAYYAAAVDERICAVAASSGVATWESSLATFSHCACNYIPGVANYFDMGDIGGLIAPRKLVLIGATEDKWYPVRGLRECFDYIEKAYSAAGASDKCKLIIKEGARRFYAEDAWSAIV